MINYKKNLPFRDTERYATEKVDSIKKQRLIEITD